MAGDHDLYALLVDTAVRERDTDGLERYLELAEETANRVQHPLFQAIVARARGVSKRMAGDIEGARSDLQQALEHFSELDTKWQLGRTLVELAELELENQDAERARKRYATAQAAFDSIGAAPDASRVHQMLAEI